MSKIKLIAVDLDGSLLQNNREISPTNRYWIQEAEKAGITVAFATGRGRITSEKYWAAVQPTSPMILLNGAEVWLNHQKLLKRYFFPTSHVPYLHELAEKHNALYWGHIEDQMFGREDWPQPLPTGAKWLKFGLAHDDLELIERLRPILAKLQGLEVTSSAPRNLEVSKKGANKAAALALIARVLGIEPAQVAVVGDGLNDLKMIEWAGLGAAMGNALPVVKEAADWVTGSNEEDGVAQFIQSILEQG